MERRKKNIHRTSSVARNLCSLPVESDGKTVMAYLLKTQFKFTLRHNAAGEFINHDGKAP